MIHEEISPGKHFGIQSGRHQYQFQILSSFHQIFETNYEEVGLEIAFMNFIKDKMGDGEKQWIRFQPFQHDTRRTVENTSSRSDKQEKSIFN